MARCMKALRRRTLRCRPRGGLINLGYDLFLDRTSSPPNSSPQTSSDDSSSLPLGFPPTGHHPAGCFFHLFNWDTQVDLAKRLVKLTKSTSRDSLLVGAHVGCPAQRFVGRRVEGYVLTHSDPWKELWDQISRETGIQFSTEVIESKYAEQESMSGTKSLHYYPSIHTVRGSHESGKKTILLPPLQYIFVLHSHSVKWSFESMLTFFLC